MKNFTVYSLISILSLLLFYKGYSQESDIFKSEPTIFNGSTVVEQVYSPSLEGNLQGNSSTQAVKVYLPPGYNTYPENEYPVLYILHGCCDQNYNSYYTGAIDLFNRLNRLISERIMIPMIIVTPSAGTPFGGSMYTNSYVSGNWEDYIVQDVIQSIENKYRILNTPESRGLSGFSMGASGTAKIAMKHPSLFNSIGLMGAGALDFEEQLINGSMKDYMLEAARIGYYRPSDHWYVGLCFAMAVAFAPDSTAKPDMGRLPIDADGVIIDSIWQLWLMHDPLTMLPTYKDSLQKLNAIQMYIGDQDDALPANESFHLALLDHGIEHGYEIYSTGHSPGLFFDGLFSFFSEHLVGVVPTVHLSNDYYLENTDNLIAEIDMDGEIYIVPVSTNPAIDSIYKYQVASIDALANEEYEFQLSGFEFGKYRVFAESSDSAVSNIPAEFCVVPDTSPPILSLVSDSVNLGDSIRVKISRDGSICLHIAPFLYQDTLYAVSEITSSSRLIENKQAQANTVVSFSTDDLAAKPYWIYGFDQYGIVTGPISVDIVTSIRPIYNNPLEIALFPNPVKEKVTVHASIPDVYEITITGLKGQSLFNERMEGTIKEIDLSSFQKGIYIIKIRSKSNTITRKIIKL